MTLFQPSGEKMFIYDAAMKYMAEGTPTVVFGGEEYGTGSSRDWAAKGTQLLGIKAVVAQELRAHPPLEPGRHGRAAAAVQARRLVGVARHPRRRDLRRRGRHDAQAAAGCDARHPPRPTDKPRRIPLILRIDTPIEVDYYKHGGILPFVLRQLLAA